MRRLQMKLIKKYFHIILLLVCIVITLLNLVNCWIFKIEYILLSENQILYIYSSLAQVIGAILGLTIAGYSMIDSKMKSLSETDTTITEYVEDIRHEYYVSLMYIIILSTIDIIFCLIILAVYDNTLNTFAPFFMTETIIIFVFIMIELIRFVCYLNPNTINEKGNIDKDSIDAEYGNYIDKNKSNENFSPFITYYNLLEKLLKDFACNLINSPHSTHKIQFFESLDILLHEKIINQEAYSIINGFRRYRNALVHSSDTDKSVNPQIYNELEKIYKLLKSVYDARTSEKTEEYNNAQTKFNSYTSKRGYNETDKKILDYLTKHPDASINDVAEYINCSSTSAHHRIANLQKIGLISKTGEKRQTKWNVINTNSD